MEILSHNDALTEINKALKIKKEIDKYLPCDLFTIVLDYFVCSNGNLCCGNIPSKDVKDGMDIDMDMDMDYYNYKKKCRICLSMINPLPLNFNRFLKGSNICMVIHCKELTGWDYDLCKNHTIYNKKLKIGSNLLVPIMKSYTFNFEILRIILHSVKVYISAKYLIRITGITPYKTIITNEKTELINDPQWSLNYKNKIIYGFSISHLKYITLKIEPSEINNGILQICSILSNLNHNTMCNILL